MRRWRCGRELIFRDQSRRCVQLRRFSHGYKSDQIAVRFRNNRASHALSTIPLRVTRIALVTAKFRPTFHVTVGSKNAYSRDGSGYMLDLLPGVLLRVRR